jgi:hypothetical protein
MSAGLPASMIIVPSGRNLYLRDLDACRAD